MPDAARSPFLPTAAEAAESWAAMVRAGREQVERLREDEEPTDFYAPMARRFAQDPRRTDDPGLDGLLALAEPDSTWLDIGAGAGRYSMPLALHVRRVYALDPSASMLQALRDAMLEHDIDNIDIIEGDWLSVEASPSADVALMAHVGYDIEAFGSFLDAAEESTDRCVVVMRRGTPTASGHVLWEAIHGEPRRPYPMLQELLVLLLARGAMPSVSFVERATWGYTSPEALLEASRRQLWLRAGSVKDMQLERLITERATERQGYWAVDWQTMPDGIVTWRSRP